MAHLRTPAVSDKPSVYSRTSGEPEYDSPDLLHPKNYGGTGSDSLRKNRPSGSEDEIGDSMSEGEEHEMGEIGSNAGSDVDEETGLNAKERKKYSRRKRRRNHLEERIAGGDGTSADAAAKLADKNVLRRLLVNSALIGLWYLFSLSISIYNKWMFSPDHLNFHFPLFTTSLHMVVQFTLASTVLLCIPSLRPEQPQDPDSTAPPKKLITPLFYLTRLVPCGTTTSLDIGLGNTSLRYITLTFYTMCKSSVLGFVLLFAFLFRLETPSLKLIAIILTMTLGVLMMVFGETAFHALGFALAMSASFFSGFRWALTQILLLRHPSTSNPFSTLFLLSPIMFVTLFTIALFAETPAAVLASLSALSHQYTIPYVILLLLFPGCLAFCMIAAEFTLLKRTSVVTLSICGIFKEVVTIAAAEIVFHDYLTLINLAGLLVTIVSIAAYNYIKIAKMRRDARKDLANQLEEQEAAAASRGTSPDHEGSFGSGSESNSLVASLRKPSGRLSSSSSPPRI